MAPDPLAQLADEIRAELEAVDGRDALRHALAAGEALNKAKKLTPRGQWLPWLESIRVPGRTATMHMKLAANRQRVADLDSVRAATTALKPKKQPAEKPKKPRSKEGARRKRESAEQRRQAQLARDLALMDLLKQQERLAEIVRILETTDFRAEFELDDLAVDALMQMADDLVTTIEWCDRALGPIRERLGAARIMELIRKLENTEGRAPEEAEAFRRRAALLRRKHGLELVA